MFPEDKERSKEFTKLLDEVSFIPQETGRAKYEIGIAIVDLKESEPKIFGYNFDHFIYPASVYKIFIGAEVLRRIEIGDFEIGQIVEIKSPNDVDKDARLFPGDTRKLLNAVDKVSVDYLLDLMLTRSDNTASNTLIDLVGHESITENIIYKYDWHGSEVTRKFLDRVKEDKSYRFSDSTKTCARHVAEFFYTTEKEKLVSPFVSQKLKEYMLRFNKGGKKGLWLPGVYKNYYSKGGWLETNLYKKNPFSLFKAIFTKGWAVIRWSHDAGVVTGENSHYVISVFSVSKIINPNKKFPIQKLAKLIYDFMENEKSI